MVKDNIISLKGGEIFITSDPRNTYKVLKGTALVYILPVDSQGNNGRRMFVCEAKEEMLIPSLCHTDYEQKKWSFGIVALDKSELVEETPASVDETKRAFASYIRLSNYEMEGFEEGLVEWYRLSLLKEEGFIHKTAREQKQVYESSLNLIYNVFHKTHKKVFGVENTNVLYNAVKILCDKNRIAVADYEKVVSVCPDNISVENIARISHFICRKIVLEEKWYKKDIGSVIAFSEDNSAVYACIPKRGGYVAYNAATGERVSVNRNFADSLSFNAYMCYRPFENKKMNFAELLKFGMQSIRWQDMVRVLLMTLIGSLTGLLIPTINQQLYDTYIPLGMTSPFIQICFLILAFMIGNAAFSIVKSLSAFRITGRITADVQSAVYDRLFNLPESFFRKYGSGDLAQRAMGAGELVNNVIGMILSGVMTVIFCGVYLVKMLNYSTLLSFSGIALIAVYIIFSIIMSLKTFKYEKEVLELSGKTGSVMLQLLSGISKIRIAGVEDRALYEYLKPYTSLREKSIKSGKLELIVSTVSVVFDTLISVTMYVLMVKCDVNISMGAFIAFNSAFGSFTSSVISLSESIVGANYIKPSYERIKDITETLPEADESGELPGEIMGDIDINNVSFSYGENLGNVLSDINIHIKSGEYVAIVGPSGCGKSTLLKLLLGFEKPTQGKIYYDNRDIDSLDKRELRKKLGVVLQDGKLISGSIYDNITITAPGAAYEDVIEVIQSVGLEDDISRMPMGLHTVLSEDCGTISGGQQQRILIARAIAGKPRILLFDEATSALDNLTQATVCESLEKLNVTRLVIAHRLSTVINCDRIIVMNEGKITEQGSYDELMEKRGMFFELASRQTV